MLRAIRFDRAILLQTLAVTTLAIVAAVLLAHVTFPALVGLTLREVGLAVAVTAGLVAAPIGFGLVQVIRSVTVHRQRLAEREVLLAQVQRFVDVGYWELCLNTRTFRLSETMHELLGDAGHSLQLTCAGLLQMAVAKDRPALAVTFEELAAGISCRQVEFDLQRSDGRIRTFRLIGAKKLSGPHQSPKAFGAIQDITEQREMEAALRASEDHYRHAVDLNPQIPWMEDAHGNSLEISPRWVELTGLTVEESKGTNWVHILHPDDYEQTVHLWEEALRRGYDYDVEYRLRLADGTYRWFRARASARRTDEGEILCWYGTLEDIHERKTADIALRASEAFAASILHGSTDCVEVIGLDGLFQYMNPPGRKLLDIDTVEPFLDQNWTDLWPLNDAPRIREAVDQAASGRSVRFTSSRPTHKGVQRWWDVCLSPIPGPDGQPARLLCTSRDVTASRVAQVELERAKEDAEATARVLRNVLESTTDSVLILDREWEIRFINERARALLLSGRPVLDQRLWQLAPMLVGTVFEDRLRTAASGGTVVSFEEYCEPLAAWLEVHAYPSAAGLSVFFRDVSSKRQSLHELEYLAHHDSLTGLLNRAALRSHLDRTLIATSPECPTALLFLDLDEFKSVNDSLGHQAGDHLLRLAASRLRTCLRDTDVIARFGGDEFAVVYSGSRHPDDIGTLAKRIIEALSKPYPFEDRHVVVGASVGIALANSAEAEADDLLKRADIALYRAKSEGRGCFRFFETGMDDDAVKSQELRADLRNALSGDELRLRFQPIMNLQTSAVAGFEALLRWQHPRRGLTSPAEFIGLAEMTGAIIDIDRWVLRKACATAAQWPGDLSISVNLTAGQFKEQGLVDAVATALVESNLPADRLRLEITEAALLQDSESVRAMLASLRQMGVRISIDDFGTGYSSLGYLRRFQIDNIKIDRSFVADLNGDARTTPILRAITTLGQDLGISITAEGIETPWQADRLQTMGCHEGQGFHFGAPLDAFEVCDFISANRQGRHVSALVER
ncbi:sensor domain-containing protein [Rubellimicrobium rubrum]|nr:EAL domain-containing protein [Rubellimicrobium rubrum]